MLARGALRSLKTVQCRNDAFSGLRSFASSSIHRQTVGTLSEDGRTTHFGFETVAEAEKQARGKICSS